MISRLLTPYTPPIKDSRGRVIPSSISSLEKVRLGDIDQWITIRGYDTNNPALLFLHGGPGSAEILFANLGNKKILRNKLEKNFIVVNWDQRGCGKSYTNLIPRESMTIEQFASDTYDLVKLLVQKLNKNKIYLVGHSWGAVLATLIVQRYPELFHAYVSIAPLVCTEENERLSYQFVLDRAINMKNKKAIGELNEIGFFPQKSEEISNYLETKRKWISQLNENKYYNKFLRDFLFFLLGMVSPEYSFFDSLNFSGGIDFSRRNLWKEMVSINFIEQIKSLNVPTYFCLGRHDYITPSTLTEKYYKMLKAPLKEIIWFENSGHAPHVEESEKFNRLMSQIAFEKTVTLT